MRKPPARKGRGLFHAQNLLESNGQTDRFLLLDANSVVLWMHAGTVLAESEHHVNSNNAGPRLWQEHA